MPEPDPAGASASCPVVDPANPIVSVGDTHVNEVEPPSAVLLLYCTWVFDPPAEPEPDAHDAYTGSDVPWLSRHCPMFDVAIALNWPVPSPISTPCAV